MSLKNKCFPRLRFCHEHFFHVDRTKTLAIKFKIKHFLLFYHWNSFIGIILSFLYQNLRNRKRVSWKLKFGRTNMYMTNALKEIIYRYLFIWRKISEINIIITHKVWCVVICESQGIPVWTLFCTKLKGAKSVRWGT